MVEYFYKVEYKEHKRKVTVQSADDTIIGTIDRDVIRGCEENSTFSYLATSGLRVSIGMKHRKFRDMNIARYVIVTPAGNYRLRERPGKSLLKFKVDGKIDNDFILVDENSNSVMNVFCNKRHIMSVKDEPPQYATKVNARDSVGENSVEFATGILMYFMYKIYKREEWYIERAL